MCKFQYASAICPTTQISHSYHKTKDQNETTHPFRANKPIPRFPRFNPEKLPCPRPVNPTIYNQMRHMHTFRPKLPRQTLRQRAKREFARGETGALGAAAERGCGAGEN